jgi:hypothetical protein
MTERTPDVLVVEQDAGETVWFSLIVAAAGAIGCIVGWMKGEWLLLFVSATFFLVCLKIALFAPTTTHKFDRGQGLVTIHSRNLWRAGRRELPFGRITDVVLDQMRVPHSGLRYRILYITADGERIAWTDFRQLKDDQVECLEAAREFLGMRQAQAD